MSARRRAYISSTHEDLKEYLEIASTVLYRYRYQPVMMEHYPEGDGLIEQTSEEIQEVLASSDVFVGIYAWRYGYQPEGNNVDGLSIVEIEYRIAMELDKPRLLFLLDEYSSWNPSYTDLDRTRIKAFRALVSKENTVAKFASPATFLTKLSIALEALSSRTAASPPAPSPEDVAAIRSFIDSRERVARLLASIVLADRSRLTLLESPNSAAVADVLASQSAQDAAGVAGLIERMQYEAFEPDPLWLAWITNVHGERLDEIGAELLRVSGIVQLS